MPTSSAEATLARAQLCEYARDIWQRGLGAAGDGNLSVRVGDDRLFATPSACHKGKLRPDDIVVCDLQGRPLGPRKPSSEIALHVEAYRRRPDVRAVIHAHPPIATAFNLAGGRLSDVLVSEVIFAFGQVASAPYTTPTTADVPTTLGAYFACYDAVMMARHGSVTLGDSLERAFIRLDAMEHTAKVVTTAQLLGGAATLSQSEVDRLYLVATGSETPRWRREGADCPPLEPGDASLPTDGAANVATDRQVVEAVLRALTEPKRG